jgi:hypothetical protein
MTERGDSKDVESEMPEDGPLLGNEDTQHPSFQQRAPKRWRIIEWLIWGVLMLLGLVLVLDNIRLRQRQSSVSAFGTDLSKSLFMTMNNVSVSAKLLRIQLLRSLYLS